MPLEQISADCPKRQTPAAYDQCMALYPDLVTSLTSALPPKPDIVGAVGARPQMTRSHH